MTNPSNIERIVMRRVHTIRVLRPMVSAGALSALVCILALWGIGREVWVARVFENMPHSANAVTLAQFYLAAFDQTRLVVQALTLLTISSFVYMVRETVRLTKNTLTSISA